MAFRTCRDAEIKSFFVGIPDSLCQKLSFDKILWMKVFLLASKIRVLTPICGGLCRVCSRNLLPQCGGLGGC